MLLDALSGAKKMSSLLGELQVSAESTGCYGQSDGIARARVEQPTRRNARRKEEGHLLDAGIRSDSDRAEDAESAVAAGTAKRDEHLIEEPIKTQLPRVLAPDSKSVSLASSYQAPSL